MRVLIAPDKFKGTLTAPEAADAIARGIECAAKSRNIQAEIDLCPVADGGEGTAAIVESALRGSGAVVMEMPATDLLGAAVMARVIRWKNEHGRFTTLIESAQVIGLQRVPEAKHDPMRYDTHALGALIASLGLGATDDLLIAIGGSATVDGGIGVVRALGWRFDDEHARAIETVGSIEGIARVAPPVSPSQIGRLRVLCDVDNPLLGARGAARVYGPQKGATPEQVERLERGLAHLVKRCRRGGIKCDPESPGAGAAGGLGFGLATFLGAELVPGAAYLLDLIGFDARVARADVVMTGEGRLDAQTARRKAPMEVARAARTRHKPVLAVVGSLEADGSWGEVFDSVTACADDASDAAARLADASARAFGGWVDLR